MEQNTFLEKEDLGTLMRKFSIPCIVSLLVGALYNIVDQIFIANASYLGSYGNAANTVVFPLTVVALAIAVTIGDGCSTFLSMSLGAKKVEDGKKSVGSAVLCEIVFGLLLMAIYIIFKDDLVTAFGGRVNEQTFEYAKEYFFWISIGIPFYMFGQGLNPVIRADGSPKTAMAVTLAGALTNLILDPLFIYSFKMGMKGAAIATVIGQVVTAVWTAVYLCKMKTVKLSFSQLRIYPSVFIRYIPLGLTSFLSQISLVASMAACNGSIQKYSLLDPVFSDPSLTQIPMAVIGIVMKFFQIVISIVVGMAAGCAPVAAYNIGAKRDGRVRDLFLLLIKMETLVGLVALAVTELLPRQLIMLFGAGNESVYYTDFAVRSFRIYLSMVVLACVNKAVFIYLQALGKVLLSTGLSMFREVVLGVALPILLPMAFGLTGILYSMPLADILTFIMTAISSVYILRLLKKDT